MARNQYQHGKNVFIMKCQSLKILGFYRELKLIETTHCIVRTKHRSLSAEMMGEREKRFWKQGSHHTALENGCQNPSCIHGTCLHPAHCYSQRCLRCSTCWD